VRRLSLCLAALFGSVLTIAGAAIPASAITGGEPDGNRHPNVGLILAYQGGVRVRCSATLISPTVLLTAGHCAAGTSGSTLVTFDSAITALPPAPFPAAADPDAGFTPAEITDASYLSGAAIAHPAYSPVADLNSLTDVGVIVLHQPARGISPAQLAPSKFLNEFAPPRLSSTMFTVVGYGTEVRKSDSGPQQPQAMNFPLLRRYTTSPGQKLTPRILQLNSNPHDTRGGGGTCLGDSGGPVFLGQSVVAVSSYGLTANCRYVAGYQRVDISDVQDWLDSVLNPTG
jgi:hypothetical protein